MKLPVTLFTFLFAGCLSSLSFGSCLPPSTTAALKHLTEKHLTVHCSPLSSHSLRSPGDFSSSEFQKIHLELVSAQDGLNFMELSPDSLCWIHQTCRRRRRDVIFFFFFHLIFFFSFSDTVFTSDTSLCEFLLLSNSYYGYTSSFDLSKKAKPNQHKKQSLSSRRVYFYFIFIFFKLASINSGLYSSDISKLFFPLV